ncbi:hypothetical protein PoB_002164000 [Plakobranchus ocellatus]|uniref:Uncharacterized protein n=1 Tax=Plakobranchus ocellatus TaxID=259542 RepID=A0AAV3ZHM8_9GAST|nr:hypothetical protein PoB_002164000 [Plakobranchus ocellatus]
MDLIGHGIKNFLVGLLKDLPIQLQSFVLICLFFVLILMPLLMMGYSFNFLYLINISPQREVRETQYARADLASSENSIESQSNLKSLNQASPSGIVKPQPLGSKGAFKKNAIAEGSVSMPHIQIPTINYGPPEGTAHVQALASALESPSRKMGPVLEQPDGGDVKREVAGMGIRARPGAFSNPSQASGDIDTSEASNNSELCQKLAQVTIGQKEASKIDEDNDLDKGCDCNARQGRDVESVSQLSSDLSGGLSNSDVAVELQKLCLNEGKNSSDVLQSLDTRNDNVVEQENQKPK